MCLAPEKRQKAYLGEINSFGKKSPNLGVLDAKGSFSGNTYIQRSNKMDIKDEDSNHNNYTTNSSGVFGSLNKDLSPSNMLLHPNSIDGDVEKYVKKDFQPNLKKLMFRRTAQTNSLLQFHGKLVLRDLNQERAKLESRGFKFAPSRPKDLSERENDAKENEGL